MYNEGERHLSLLAKPLCTSLNRSGIGPKYNIKDTVVVV